MADRLVTIFGGSGFIGRHIVRRFAAAGWRVRIAVRDTRKATFLKPAGDLGQISLVPVSVADDAGVATAVHGADAVIYAVGVLYERGRRTFNALHVDGPARVARAAAAAGASHFVHLSALGAAADSPSSYARSKAAGEAAVQEAFPTATILRPSVVFGPEDGFFNLFGSLAQKFPVLPFFTDIVPHAPGGGGPKFQPVYVGDVAQAAFAAVTVPGHAGELYELVGPRVYDMREILEIVNRETMRRRWIIGMPFLVARAQAMVLQFLPQPLLTPDQVTLLKLGNVGTGRLPGLDAFGIPPTAVEGIVGNYLKRFRPVQQTKRLRVSPRNGG
jgi:NADH dehydrogenase